MLVEIDQSTLNKIVKPTFIISESRVKKNIQTMKSKAQNSQAEFRPHFKTHQSQIVGDIYRSEGVTKITVSSVDMAMYFAEKGWNDITIAFPVNIRQISDINVIANKIKLNLLVESMAAARFLDMKLEHKVGCAIKIDAGYHRTGMNPKKEDVLDEIIILADFIHESEKLIFDGLLTHAGHAYIKSNNMKRNTLDIAKSILTSLKIKLRQQGIDDVKLSYGDTPTCSVFNDFSEFDELRPGNFVFYDVIQLELGSCTEEDIACLVACPVVSKHMDESKVIIHGGGVHFSKDVNEETHYGYLVGHNQNLFDTIDKNLILKQISQDHGEVQITNRDYLEKIKVGDVLYFYPIHSCMTADLLKNNVLLIE